ncbi:MAG: lytic transglycosylase domain-containing protein [Bacteriovoracaceae bacterium]|nr:lytic transglycosylase domain-containing protein [Bacteriovoracaceae bacterium]
MKTLTTNLLILMFLYSCAHKPMVPPPTEKFLEETRKLLKSNSSELDNYTHLNMEQKWARIYLHGKQLSDSGRNGLACNKFKALEETPFPLPILVDIQILKVCPISVIEARKRMDYPKNEVHPWAKEEFLLTALKRSREFGLTDHQAKFLGELAFYQETREQKVHYLKKSIKMAQDSDLKKKLQEKLEILSPSHIKNPTDDQLYDYARDLERFRKFEEARKHYTLIGHNMDSTIEEVVKAYERKAMSWKIQRSNKKYREILEELLGQIQARFDGDEKVEEEYLKYYFKYKILIARRFWTENKRKKAHKLLDEVIADKRATQTQLAHAYWLKGSIYSEFNHFKKSLANYKLAFEKEIDDENIFLKVSWSYAWTLYLKKQYSASIEIFDRSLEKIEDPLDKLRYQFWLAKTLWKNKKKNKARDIYMDLLKNAPQHYYGILARAEMNMTFPKAPELQNKLAEDFTIMWLKSLDELGMGKDYLEGMIPKLSSNEQKLAYIPYFSSVEWFEGGLKTYFSLPSKERYKLSDAYLPLVFPTPYKKLIKKASKKFRISPSFLYSIMRQESAFDPEARSWADAFGLLQLTPERAKELRRRAGVKYKTYSDLYDPETNIYLGARLLKDLQVKFKNNFISYVGSYNASERAVKHWKKTRFRGDFLEYIERIPYDETRKYVKLVLRNYINYKRSLTPKPFLFPKRFFTSRLTD